MEPGDHNTSHTPYRLDADGVDRLLNDVRGPLTAITGCAQLVQRRIRNGSVTDVHDLEKHLAVIERSARSIEEHLRKLDNHTRQP